MEGCKKEIERNMLNCIDQLSSASSRFSEQWVKTKSSSLSSLGRSTAQTRVGPVPRTQFIRKELHRASRKSRTRSQETREAGDSSKVHTVSQYKIRVTPA